MTTAAVHDDELRHRLQGVVANPARPNWRDVRQRARTYAPSSQRRRLLLAAAVVAAAVAGPALAIATGVIDFSSAPPAPAPIKVLFSQLAKLSGPNIPGPITAPPRVVYTFQTGSGSFDLAAAPAANGGWCWIVVGRDGTCNTRDGGLNYGANQPPPVGGEPLLIDGSIAASDVTKIAITFEDGTTLDLPFVQVSAPIDADFFLYEIPPNHWTHGNRPATIAAYNSTGTIVGSGWFIRESDKPPVGVKS